VRGIAFSGMNWNEHGQLGWSAVKHELRQEEEVAVPCDVVILGRN
jgi:hypothetical protein